MSRSLRRARRQRVVIKPFLGDRPPAAPMGPAPWDHPWDFGCPGCDTDPPWPVKDGVHLVPETQRKMREIYGYHLACAYLDPRRPQADQHQPTGKEST